MSEECNKADIQKAVNMHQGTDCLIVVSSMLLIWIFAKNSSKLELISILAFVLVLLSLINSGLYSTKLHFIKKLNKLGYNIPNLEDKSDKKEL